MILPRGHRVDNRGNLPEVIVELIIAAGQATEVRLWNRTRIQVGMRRWLVSSARPW
jgi:hypothetical protein